MSLICKKNPEDLKLVLIDPKGTELSPLSDLLETYSANPAETISKSEETAEKALSALCLELEKRSEMFQKAGVRDIISFNCKQKDYHLPYIVCICDEYADLLMGAIL